LDVDPSTGDFDRAAEEKGDEVDAKASNPERFVAEVEDSPEEEVGKGGTGVWFMGKGEGDGDDLLDENIFWPLTAAKGELVDAYAIKPLYL
jgi:hypothetical protein